MTISEVSEKYGLPADTLRYYEKAGLIPPVNRTLQKRKHLLIAERDRLKQRIEEMQQTLERLNYKISVYEDKIVACEKKLLK